MIEPSIPSRFWATYPPEIQPLVAPTWLGGAGGLSGSDLWRVEATAGPMMVRAWPSNGPTRDRITEVHRWLSPLGCYAWVAVPIADRQGRTVLQAAGRCWEVTRFLPGQADLNRPPGPGPLHSMFAALAKIHTALSSTARSGPSPGLIARIEELDRLIAWEFDHLRRAIDGAPGDAVQGLAATWLRGAPALASGVVGRVRLAARRVLSLQPVLRDVRPDHFLFEGGELTGLVDFGAMGIDAVATDLARLLGEAVGPNLVARRDALATYETVRPLTAEDRAIVTAFEAANAVLGGARWVRWHYVEGRRFADPAAVELGLNRACKRLGEWSLVDG